MMTLRLKPGFAGRPRGRRAPIAMAIIPFAVSSRAVRGLEPPGDLSTAIADARTPRAVLRVVRTAMGAS